MFSKNIENIPDSMSILTKSTTFATGCIIFLQPVAKS